MRGREVAFACSLDAALSAMEREQFNLLVVDPHTDGESHGVRFVRALKWMDPRELGAPLVELAHSYRHVPSILTPPAGTSEYAVFLTRTNWFLFDSSRIPLEDTILACSPLRP